MAKKDKAPKGDKKKGDSAGSKLIAFIIALVIVIIWLAIFAICIKLDVGGFGSNVLRPILKDVPVVNKILPSASIEEMEDENTISYAEALKLLKELEKENDELKASNKEINEKLGDKSKEVDRLKVFEENQNAFKQEQKQFYDDIVYTKNAPDISEYAKYYESIDPTTAAEIYRQVTEKLVASDEVKQLAKMYSTMKPTVAAGIFNIMTGDLDLLADILKNMTEAKSSAILGAMDSSMAAKLTKKLYPEE